MARGFLVLSDSLWPRSIVWTSGSKTRSGCIGLAARGVDAVATILAGQGSWIADPELTMVGAFWSIRATLDASGQTFRGVRAYGESPQDVIVGQRIGAPDSTRCSDPSVVAANTARRIDGDLSNMRGTRVFPPSIDPKAGYILYFWDTLVDSVPPPTRCIPSPPAPPGPCVAEERSGYFGAFMTFGRLLAPPGTFVVAAAPSVISIAAQIDSTVARVDQLIGAGVPASHLLLFGSGRATEIVRRVAALVPEGVALGFVGRCAGAPDPRADVNRPTRVIFDAFAATTAAPDRCGSRFTPAPGSKAYQLPDWFDAGFRDGSDDWLDPARAWITAWIGHYK